MEQNQEITLGAVRNANSRTIFKSPELCCQFLRDNFDIPLLKTIRPEDIEDVSEKYQAYLGIELESDSVKRIRINPGSSGSESEIYVVSLIEHKSYVDYNVPMQLLKYMTCIWDDYAREMDRKHPGITEKKSFRYPPILPVVYYEGKDNWTADIHFRNKIFLKEAFNDYLPDFTYHVVRIHDYSNAELLERDDEMSLLMMLNKVQSPEDMEAFLGSRKDRITEIIQNAPEHIIDIIASTIHNLCIKMNMTTEHAAQCVEAVKERNMGYLFENMERLDIQLERKYDKKYRELYAKEYEEKMAKAEQEFEKAEQRLKIIAQQESEKARQESEKARQESEKARQESEKAKQESEKAKQESEKAKQESEKIREKAMESIVSICQNLSGEKELAIQKLMDAYSLSRSEAESKTHFYWDKE